MPVANRNLHRQFHVSRWGSSSLQLLEINLCREPNNWAVTDSPSPIRHKAHVRGKINNGRGKIFKSFYICDFEIKGRLIQTFKLL